MSLVISHPQTIAELFHTIRCCLPLMHFEKSQLYLTFFFSFLCRGISVSQEIQTHPREYEEPERPLLQKPWQNSWLAEGAPVWHRALTSPTQSTSFLQQLLSKSSWWPRRSQTSKAICSCQQLGRGICITPNVAAQWKFRTKSWQDHTGCSLEVFIGQGCMDRRAPNFYTLMGIASLWLK